MRLSCLAQSAVGVVLIFGLGSCSQDHSSQDVYSPPSPIAKTVNGDSDLRDWDMSGHKRFDIQDALDFSKSGAAIVRVRTQCRLDGEYFYAQASFVGTPTLSMFRVVPREVMLTDLDLHPTECSFEVTLFNTVGSSHVFNIAAVPVVDHRDPAVLVEHEPQIAADNGILRILVTDSRDIWIRHPSPPGARAQLFCADDLGLSLPFDQALELSAFNLHHTSSALHEVLFRRPLQTCRVVITADGQPVALSRRMELVFTPRPLTQQLLTADVVVDPAFADLPSPLSSVLFNGALENVAGWRLTNPDPEPRYIKIAKQNIPNRVHVYVQNIVRRNPATGNQNMDAPSDTHGRLTIEVDRGHAHGQILAENPDYLILRLDPGQSVGLSAVFHMPRGFAGCHMNHGKEHPPLHLMGLGVTFHAPPTYLDVNEQGHAISTTTLNVYPTYSHGRLQREELSQYAPFPDDTECGYL